MLGHALASYQPLNIQLGCHSQKEDINQPMPIYEYKCGECSRRVSLFFPSFNIAEERIAAGETKCPRCGSQKLTRLMSRVYSHRAEDDSLGDLSDGGDMLPEGLDDEDPRAIARWARRMKDSMGDEMDMGPEFDQA